MSSFSVAVGAGTLRDEAGSVASFPHAWTADGVTVDALFTGAHLFHLAAAGCVLNDVFREAERLGVRVDGVRVRASGDFDTEKWESTGVNYFVDIDGPASSSELESLLDTVDAVAEIPKAMRAGARVERARIWPDAGSDQVR